MVLHPQSMKPIPPLTQEIAYKAFPKGNLYMTLRDELGTFYDDNDFAQLYSSEGQPALHPGCLALVCVMQYMANLSDRGAAEAVAARIDWKYALGLELTDPGFDFSILSLFRSRLLSGGKEQILLDRLLTTQAHLSDVDQTESIHQSLAEKELLPSEHLVDAGYVDGTLLVESRQQHNIELIGPVRDNVSWQSKNPEAYDLSRFKINWKKQQATCPVGVKSTKKWTIHQDQWDNTVIKIKFPRKACRECQFRPLCTRSLTEPREITLRPQEEHLALVKRRKQQETKTWLKKYNQRAGVEGTISQGVRGFGLRKCRYVGLDKVHLQHILTATAMNAIRLFARERRCSFG